MKNLNYLNQHARPVTRRQFISRGLASAGGIVAAPTVLGMLARNAYADTTKPAPKFITFDLAGGAALFANFLVGGAGGPQDLLPSYNLMGWDPRVSGAIDTRFGLPMANPTISQMMSGISTMASAAAQANFRMASLAHIGQTDSSENPLSILGLVSQSGLAAGADLSTSTGIEQTFSGGNSASVVDVPAYRPSYIQNVDTLVHSVGAGGALKNLSQSDVAKVGKLLNRLSQTQLNGFLSGSLDASRRQALSSIFGATSDKMLPASGLDPRLDPISQKIYGIDQNSDGGSDPVLRAALVMATLRGLSGPSVITIGGCDYHDGTQTSGDKKDLEIGQEIGRAIEAAKQIGVPLFIHIITDGGIYPQSGSRIWSGDNVETCMSVMGLYRPDAVPQYVNTTPTYQIGNYTTNQGADRSTLIGSSPALAAYSVFANYLNACGNLDQFGTLTSAPLTANQLKQVVTFAPIV